MVFPGIDNISAITAVSMSSETMPWERSSSRTSRSVVSPSVVHIFPWDRTGPGSTDEFNSCGTVDNLFRVNQGPNRSDVLDRAGDADDGDLFDGDGVEETLGSLPRQFRSHSGEDGDNFAVTQVPEWIVNSSTCFFRRRQLSDQGTKFHRHGTDEGEATRYHRGVHPASLPPDRLSAI